ncbi:MAG: RagB/SusD family nutrient uptake outer membrane protein [Bacteroidetes bacterium]|nr:RagB/SusD family nutrient uptake outer membrane protein [Candidatus Colenecus caballi]
MKKINSLFCIALMGASLSSCNDFLTLMPLNEIVLENFWTDKSDVESVLLGAYSALESSDCVLRMSAWGEMRSDNIIAADNAGDDIKQITKDNILSTNTYTKYKCFYDVINRANTVLHFAPEVAEKDPNYTGAELQNTIAEAVALRALSYWYLIRAYKDVPYTTVPSIDDTHDFFIGQSSFEEILDNLIADLDSVERYSVNKYTSDLANTARFTRVSINAMLADMYLWKAADYRLDKSEVQKYLDLCIERCEKVEQLKMDDYEKLKAKKGTDCTVELFGKDTMYPLISENYKSNGASVQGNVYNEMFGDGNCFEILFELPFDSKVKNPLVESYYNGKELNGGNLYASIEVGKEKGNEVFTMYDCRYQHNIKKLSTESSNFGITKYAYQSLKFDISTGTVQGKDGKGRENTSPNWIIYRYTDVLLMKAEALVLKSKSLGTADSVSTIKADLLNQAFQIVYAINYRAVNRITELKKTDYPDDATMEELVLQERRRELMFEGKRWFDLVRRARNEGNTKTLWDNVSTKYESSTASAVRIKLSDMDAMYFPLNRDEIKINNLLIQNHVYLEEEEVQKAN